MTWDGRGRLLCRTDCRRSGRHDNIHFESDQLGSEVGEPVLALNPAARAQPLLERCDDMGGDGSRGGPQESNAAGLGRCRRLGDERCREDGKGEGDNDRGASNPHGLHFTCYRSTSRTPEIDGAVGSGPV